MLVWPFRSASAHSVRSTQPYWLLRNGIGNATDAVDRSVECDVVVVGAGITGALVANEFVAAGRKVVVIDQRDNALGSTSASTALLQYEIDTNLVDLTELLGWARASQAYQAGVESLTLLESLAGELARSVNFERRKSLYLASTEADVARLKEELAARQRAGLDVEWLDAKQLRNRFDCHRPGAILSAAGAQADPYRFTYGLLERIVERGASVYARTAVSKIKQVRNQIRLRTNAGHTITAGHAVICCGYESLRFLPEKVANLHSTYALVTDPLLTRGHAVETTLIWESARPYSYLRGTPDNRLIIGGEDLPFKNSKARDAALPRKVQKLRKQLSLAVQSRFATGGIQLGRHIWRD